jgi:hypothetical protein
MAVRGLMLALVAYAAVLGSQEGVAPCGTRGWDAGRSADVQALRLRGGDGSSAFESRLYGRGRSHQQAPTGFFDRLFSAARRAPARAGEELTWGVAAPTVLFAAAAAGIAVEATRTMQTLSDDQCLRQIEKWKRSGQAPGALLQKIVKGSCFDVEDSDGDDSGAWFTVMKVAIERGHAQTLRCLVSEHVGGVNVGTRGRHGQTALHVAAARGRERIIDILCELGADVESTDMLGWSPLHQAAYYGRTAAVRRLVEQHDASTQVVTTAGLTPLALAVEQLQRPETSSPTLSPWGDDPDSARDAEVRKASLEETVRYLSSLESRPPAGAKGSGAAPAAAAGGSKWAGLLRRFAAIRRVPKSKAATAKAATGGSVEASLPANGAGRADVGKGARSEIDRAIDQAWGAASDQGIKPSGAGAAEAAEAAAANTSAGIGEAATGASVGDGGAGGAPETPEALKPKQQSALSPAPAQSTRKASTDGGAAAADATASGDADAQAPAMCGVGITLNVNMDGEYVIKAVAPGGPADVRSKVGGKALIVPGDILEGVDGRAVRDVSYANLARCMLGPAGSKVEVAVRRGSKVSKHTLTRSPLGDSAQQAVRQGIVREQKTLKHMLRMAKKLAKEKEAMAHEISKLRARAENAENEVPGMLLPPCATQAPLLALGRVHDQWAVKR